MLTPAEDDDTAGHKTDRKEYLFSVGDYIRGCIFTAPKNSTPYSAPARHNFRRRVYKPHSPLPCRRF